MYGYWVQMEKASQSISQILVFLNAAQIIVSLQWLNLEEGLAQCEKQEAEERAEMEQKQARVDKQQAVEETLHTVWG